MSLTLQTGQKYKIWLTWGVFDIYGRDSYYSPLVRGMIEEKMGKEIVIEAPPSLIQ